MDFDSHDYFSYKKGKMRSEIQENKKPVSKLSFLLQLFVATFVIMFIIIVVAIMKYSAKMDIEYTKGDLSFRNGDSSGSLSGYSADDDEQKKIDSRLKLIQQEENAPSEAKIVNKKETEEVISREHVEENKKLERIEKIKAKNALSELNQAPKEEANKITNAINEIKNLAAPQNTKKPSNYDENITITSKVLAGRFSSFEEAMKLQAELKTKDPKSSPFVRKVGDVFSVQMGSYQDFYTAKTQAQKLKAMGVDVWIYQQ